MSLPTQDILKMSDTELEKYLASAAFGTMGRNLAMEEYTRRKLSAISKPHWSTIPSFWLLVVSVIISIIAVVISVRQLNQGSQPVPKASAIQNEIVQPEDTGAAQEKSERKSAKTEQDRPQM